MATKAQLEARIVELTRICDKETDRADAAEEDSKTLKRIQDVLGREYYDILEMVDEREHQQQMDEEAGV